MKTPKELSCWNRGTSLLSYSYKQYHFGEKYVVTNFNFDLHSNWPFFDLYKLSFHLNSMSIFRTKSVLYRHVTRSNHTHFDGRSVNWFLLRFTLVTPAFIATSHTSSGTELAFLLLEWKKMNKIMKMFTIQCMNDDAGCHFTFLSQFNQILQWTCIFKLK